MTAVRYAVPAALADIPIDRHAVIEASAGTGKTYLIEHRVVDLLLRGVELPHILVVTFTDKATEELRARVRDLIRRVLDAREHTAAEGEPCWLIDDEARSRLRRALLGFDLAPIHTIHGFCYRVLTENAFANRRLFEQTQIDRESAFADAFKAVLRTELARAPEQRGYLDAWLRAAGSLSDLERLLLAAAEAGGRLEPAFDEAATVRALEAVPAVDPDALRANEAALTAALRFPRMRTSTADKLYRRLLALADAVAGYRAGGDLPLLLAEVEAADLGAAIATIAGREPADPGAAALCGFAAALAGAVVPLTAAVVQRFLPAVSERMTADKRRRGLFDFGDMLSLVWDSLCADGGDALAARLRAQYRFALIDEFQDTDELQWKIFHRLFIEPPGSVLCVIGDPKQAIYGFRGADVFTYLDARDAMLAGGGARIALTDNYRASAALVDAYNELLRQDVDEPLFSGEIRYDEPVVARADVDADGPPVVLMRLDPDDKLNPEGIRAALGPAIAREIRDLVGAMRWRDGGEERALAHGDVFVLTRSLAESVQMSELLRAEGVPCALYKQEGLFKTREASEIRDLLRGIAEPRRQSERFAAWQTPFFAVPLADLLDARDLPETHPLIARLLDWHRLASRQAWEELFERVLSDSGLIRRELFLRDHERALTNYLHIFELLLDDARSSQLDLGELTRRLDRTIDRPAKADGSDHDVQRLESERNAVQIMTMHKAKGLEAAVVFLFGNFGRAPHDTIQVVHDERRRCCWIGSITDPELDARAKQEKREEEQRLLYVALTRAKARLYLPYIDSKQCSNVTGSYCYLRRQLERVLDDDRFARIEVAAAPVPAAAPDAAALASWQPPARLIEPPDDDDRFARWRDERRGPTVTSYTRMKQRAGAAAETALEAHALEETIERDGAAPSPGELPGGAASGVFLHEVLERLLKDDRVPAAGLADEPAFDDWRGRDDVHRLFETQLLRHGRDPAHLEHAQRIVYDSLRAPVELGGDRVDGLWRCAPHRTEVEFVYPMPTGDGFVKGFIDLVFEHAGRVYLLDWKSDTLPSYAADALAAHARAHYDLQTLLYTRAAARMLGLAGEADYGARFGGMLFCFLRGPGFWLARPPWSEVVE